MIHPFRDGNGRMARALQTLTISRHSIIEPAFSSGEEWLGHRTDDYYDVLTATGQGTWRPELDTHLWAPMTQGPRNKQRARGRDAGPCGRRGA